jgi:hypothetical protein
MNTRDISLFIYYIAKGFQVTPLDLIQESILDLLVDYINHINQYDTDYYTFYDEVFYPSNPTIRKKLKALQDLLVNESLMFDIVKDETSIRTIMVSISGISFSTRGTDIINGGEIPNPLDLSRYITALSRLGQRNAPPCFRIRQDLSYLLSPDAGLRLTPVQVTNYFNAINQCISSSVANGGEVDYQILEAWNLLPNLVPLQELGVLERKLTRLAFEKFQLTTILSAVADKKTELLRIWHYNTLDQVTSRLARVNVKIEERRAAWKVEKLRVNLNALVVKLLGEITTKILALPSNIKLPPLPRTFDYVQSLGNALIISEPSIDSELGYSTLSPNEETVEEVVPDRVGPTSTCTSCLYHNETSLRQALKQVTFTTPDETLNQLIDNSAKVLDLEINDLPAANASKGDKLDFLLTL